MLQASSDYQTAATAGDSDLELSYLAKLELAGELFEKFFRDKNISASFTILDRRNQAYPVLMLTEGDNSLAEVKSCISAFENCPCPSIRGISLKEICFEIEESESHPAGIVLPANVHIVLEFARELSGAAIAQPDRQLQYS